MNKDLSRGNKYPFFPDYDFEISFAGDEKMINLTTTIRKQNRNGVWTLLDVTASYLTPQISPDEHMANETVKRFISDCYKVIILGTCDQPLVDQGGNPIFKRDPNQESEHERLSRL